MWPCARHTTRNHVFSSMLRQSSAKLAALAWCENNPVTFGVGIATAKTGAADLLTQMAIEGKDPKDVDLRRLGLFTLFGFGYMGCFQYYLYVNLFSRWFAGAARFANQPLSKKLTDRAGQIDLLKQVAFDVLIHPIWFFPLYYTLREAINGRPNAFEAPFPTVVRAALAKYATNAKEDWIQFWKIWVVGDCVVYGLCPMWARLPANHLFSFAYVCVLSFQRGTDKKDQQDQAR